MRFYPKKDNVCRPHFFERAGDSWSRHEISLGALHLNAVLLHGAKMWPAREESDIVSSPCHARADIGSDGPGPRDQESHRCSSRSAAATARRRIFPVAVVGILSTR